MALTLGLIRKSTVSGQADGPRGAVVRGGAAGWLGGRFEGDFVSEGFELMDVVAFFAFRAGSAVVEARAEVVEAGGGIGQQVPADDQDGAADRDDGLLLAAASGDTSVAFTEEGIGAAYADRCLAQHPGQVGIAVAGGAGAFLLTG